MICKATLDRLGKAAYNALGDADKQKYTTASGIVSIITDVIKTGNVAGAAVDIGLKLTNIGVALGTQAITDLAKKLTGKETKTIQEAVVAISGYVKNTVSTLIDNIKHDIANKLAVLFGVDENPGIIGAIMEWVYKSIIQPALSLV